MKRLTLPVWMASAIATATMLIGPTAFAEHSAIQLSNQSSAQASAAENDTQSDGRGLTMTNESDERFLKEFARINAAGVDKGQLAERKAEDAKVKAFAKQLIAAHSKTIAKITTVADHTNIDVKARPNFVQKTKSAILNMSVAHSFDRAYVQEMINDAESIVDMLEREMTDGQDASIRQLAWNALPDVQRHLKVAQDLRMEVADTQFASEIRARDESSESSMPDASAPKSAANSPANGPGSPEALAASR